MNKYNITSPDIFTLNINDWDVAASEGLIGFYCGSQNMLFYYKKIDFLNGDYSSFLQKSIAEYHPLAGKEIDHKGNFKYISTTVFGDSSHFVLAYLNSDNSIKASHYWIYGYTPLKFVFGDEFSLGIAKSQIDGKYYWMISYLDPKPTRVWMKRREPPIGIAINDISSLGNKEAKNYYTVFSNDLINYILKIEHTDKFFNVWDQSSISVGKNWGEEILAYSN